MNDFTQPHLDNILGYKTVYVLCSVGKTDKLKAVYYTSTLIGGSQPLWGIWSVGSGKFVRFADSKTAVARLYDHLVWRRKVGEYQLLSVSEKKAKARRLDLAETYGRKSTASVG